MTKVKIDKNKNFIEIEGDEDFVKDFAKKQCNNFDQVEDYKNERIKISIILIIFIVLFILLAFFLICPPFFHIDKFVLGKLILGFAAGIVGLLIRNFIFLSAVIKEKKGKNLGLAYFSYSVFILFSSLLIFAVLDQFQVKFFVFYLFLVPLNFFVGLMTYSILVFLEKVLSIKISS